MECGGSHSYGGRSAMLDEPGQYRGSVISRSYSYVAKEEARHEALLLERSPARLAEGRDPRALRAIVRVTSRMNGASSPRLQFRDASSGAYNAAAAPGSDRREPEYPSAGPSSNARHAEIAYAAVEERQGFGAC